MKRKRTLRFVSVALVVSMSVMFAPLSVSALSTQQQSIGQQDKGNTSQGKKATNYLVGKGIIIGDGNGSYSMSDSLKRGDFMIMLVRAFDLESSVNENFSDVSSDSYYYNAIGITKALGIAKGDGNNFNPESGITLQEAITLIERTMEKTGDLSDVDLEKLFDDSNLSGRANREEVANMLYSILSGDTESDTGVDTITYTTEEETAITFDASDFNEVCDDETDESLSYVKFTLPSSSCGKLYYNYKSSSSYDSKVSASTKYYKSSSSYVSKVTFVPADDYTGTVTISYTGYNTEGESFTGKIKIKVTD